MNEILKYLNNYFFRFKESGTFKIVDNKITGLKGEYLNGQYLLITGSVLNEGVIQVLSYGLNEITIDKAFNEEFEGVVYSLAVPQDLKELVETIADWKINNTNNGLASESFEGYSYSKAINKSGQVATWKDVFAEELRPYRKASNGIRYVKELVE